MLEIGLSDFHLMTVTKMRNILEKLKRMVINYRSYKHFSNEAYRESLVHEQNWYLLMMMKVCKDFVIYDFVIF